MTNYNQFLIDLTWATLEFNTIKGRHEHLWQQRDELHHSLKDESCEWSDCCMSMLLIDPPSEWGEYIDTEDNRCDNEIDRWEQQQEWNEDFGE